MPNKLGLNPTLAIKLFFEREDDQHLPHVFPNQLDARLPPRPELWADVVNHRDSALVQFARQAEVEVGEIDEHGGIGTPALRLGDDFVEEPKDTRQVFHYLSQSDHCDLAGVHDQVTSGLL